MVESFVQEAEEMLKDDLASSPALIVKSSAWTSGVIGLVAARFAEKYGRPAVVLEEKAEKLTASCRGPEDFDLAKTLREIAKAVPELFLAYGGHAAAAGFSLLPAKIFWNLNGVSWRACARDAGRGPPAPKAWYDLEIGTVPTRRNCKI